MANISQIQVGSTTYDICDVTARDLTSNFMTVRLNNANSFTVSANSSMTYDFSLDNADIDSSWMIIGVMATRNAHFTASVVSNVSAIGNRTAHIGVRNLKAVDQAFTAHELEVFLLLGKIDLCPQLDWVYAPSISV